MLGLFTALAVVPLLFFSTEAVGSAGTLAISLGTSTVCGISASTLPRAIYCTNISESESTSPYLVYPNVSFDSVSADTAFLCGLKSSRRVIFCWNGMNIKKVYRGSWLLSDLTVGKTHVSAVDHSGNEIRWWSKAGLFPSSVLGHYSSLTSGNNFTCAITSNGTVTCWGPLAGAVQARFSNYSMSTIVAGDLHMCGLDSSGFVICQGNNSSGQSYAPPGLPYEYARFALGSSHTCAIKQPNGTAVCWGGSEGAHLYTPLKNMAFEFLVAGGNLTCGLVTNNYSALCWGSDWRTVSVRTLPLPMILPGICVAGGSDECKCGIYPDSGSLCAGTGVICRRCDILNPISPPRPPVLVPPVLPSPVLAPPVLSPPVLPSPVLAPPVLSPPVLPPPPSEWKRIGKRWKVEGISKRWKVEGISKRWKVEAVVVGSVGMFVGACGIAYSLWLIFCRKAHNCRCWWG